MLYPTTPDDLRRRRLIVAGIATVLLLIAVVTYAVLVHRAHSAHWCRSNSPGPTVAARVRLLGALSVRYSATSSSTWTALREV